MTAPDTDTLAGLLDCPFCGEHPGEITDATRILGVFRIIHRCKVIGPIKVESIARAFLVSAWNTRAQAAKDKARIERLEAALRPFVAYVHYAFHEGNSRFRLVEDFDEGGGWLGSEDFRRARAALEDGE